MPSDSDSSANDLIFTMTNGNEINLGPAAGKGDKGTPGRSCYTNNLIENKKFKLESINNNTSHDATFSPRNSSNNLPVNSLDNNLTYFSKTNPVKYIYISNQFLDDADCKHEWITREYYDSIKDLLQKYFIIVIQDSYNEKIFNYEILGSVFDSVKNSIRFDVSTLLDKRFHLIINLNLMRKVIT